MAFRPEASQSVRAKTSITSARDPLVTHFLLPEIVQPPPSWRAVVVIDAGSLPAPASESANPAIFVPVASTGSHSDFCASVPWAMSR